MIFRRIKITSTLDGVAILHLLKTYSYPIDAPWNTKEFDIKYVTEKTYSCVITNNTFKLRARKTNQRRQSRPIGYGKFVQGKNTTIIDVIVVPHIGSIITWMIFILLTLGVAAQTINSQHLFSIIPAVLLPLCVCVVYTLTLKYDAKDMEGFIKKTLKRQP